MTGPKTGSRSRPHCRMILEWLEASPKILFSAGVVNGSLPQSASPLPSFAARGNMDKRSTPGSSGAVRNTGKLKRVALRSLVIAERLLQIDHLQALKHRAGVQEFVLYRQAQGKTRLRDAGGGADGTYTSRLIRIRDVVQPYVVTRQLCRLLDVRTNSRRSVRFGLQILPAAESHDGAPN